MNTGYELKNTLSSREESGHVIITAELKIPKFLHDAVTHINKHFEGDLNAYTLEYDTKDNYFDILRSLVDVSLSKNEYKSIVDRCFRCEEELLNKGWVEYFDTSLIDYILDVAAENKTDGVIDDAICKFIDYNEENLEKEWLLDYIRDDKKRLLECSYTFHKMFFGDNGCALLNAIEQALKDKIIPVDSQKTYIIKDRSGLYKIGRAKNIESRIKTLKTGNAHIEIVMVIDKNVETELHREYEIKRVSGEWFILTDNDLKRISEKYKEAKTS